MLTWTCQVHCNMHAGKCRVELKEFGAHPAGALWYISLPSTCVVTLASPLLYCCLLSMGWQIMKLLGIDPDNADLLAKVTLAYTSP